MSLPARARPPPVIPPLGELVAQTSGDLYRLALRLTGDAAEADDVLQNSYLRAFEALRGGAFRGDCQLKTWLYRIVTHVAFDARRGGQRRAQLANAAPADPEASPRAESSLALRELREAMLSLPEDQRGALALKELQGLSVKEVAEVLERSEGAVEQLLVRARITLRERFQT